MVIIREWGESSTREKVKWATVQKAGSNIPTWVWLNVSPIYLINTCRKVPITGQFFYMTTFFFALASIKLISPWSTRTRLFGVGGRCGGGAGAYLRLRLWSLTGSRSGRLGSSSGSALGKNKNYAVLIGNQNYSYPSCLQLYCFLVPVPYWDAGMPTPAASMPMPSYNLQHWPFLADRLFTLMRIWIRSGLPKWCTWIQIDHNAYKNGLSHHAVLLYLH